MAAAIPALQAPARPSAPPELAAPHRIDVAALHAPRAEPSEIESLLGRVTALTGEVGALRVESEALKARLREYDLARDRAALPDLIKTYNKLQKKVELRKVKGSGTAPVCTGRVRVTYRQSPVYSAADGGVLDKERRIREICESLGLRFPPEGLNTRLISPEPLYEYEGYDDDDGRGSCGGSSCH